MVVVIVCDFINVCFIIFALEIRFISTNGIILIWIQVSCLKQVNEYLNYAQQRITHLKFM